MAFDDVQRSNYFRGEPIKKLGKLKNGKDEVTGTMIRGRSDMVVDWTLGVSNMSLENGVLAEDWRSAGIVLPYESKGKRKECKNYRGIKRGQYR